MKPITHCDDDRTHPHPNSAVRAVRPCGCACCYGGFCGGCGHAGCGGR